MYIVYYINKIILLNLERNTQNVDFIQELNDSNIYNDFDLLMSTRNNDTNYKKRKNSINKSLKNSLPWVKFLDSKSKQKARFDTGCNALNNITHGFPQGIITDLYGASATGKSQLIFQTALNAAEQNSNVLIIDSTGNFRPERILQICKAKSFNHERVFKNIFVLNSNALNYQLDSVDNILNFKNKKNVDLVLIDDLTANFTDHLSFPIKELKSALLEYIQRLTNLAWNHKLSIVITNTVRADLNNLVELEKETYYNLMNRTIHLRIYLQRINNVWRATNNYGECVNFKIDENGIKEA